MKKKDLNEFKAKSVMDLTKKLAELEKEKVNRQLELKMGKLKNVHEVKNIRGNIAQIKTILKLKLIAAQSENQTKTPKGKKGALEHATS